MNKEKANANKWAFLHQFSQFCNSPMRPLLIIEDETLQQEITELQRKLFWKAKYVVYVAFCIKSNRMVFWITIIRSDFLDIQLLSDGLSFEIFKKIDIKIILLRTAYDEYALLKVRIKQYRLSSKTNWRGMISSPLLCKFKSRLPKKQNPEIIIFNSDFEQIRKMLSNPFRRTL